jgi:hypothetical protein
MGIRYVVVPEGLAPAPFATQDLPAPPVVLATLSAQLDLEAVDVPAGLTVYRNEAFAPLRADVATDELPTDGGIAAAVGLDLTGSPVALPDADGYLQSTGPVDGGTTVYHAASDSDRWELKVDGTSVPATKVFGWSSAYDIPADGDASLRFHTPPLRYGLLLVQVVAWLWALRTLFRQRVAAVLPPVEPTPPPAHGRGAGASAATKAPDDDVEEGDAS